MLKSSNATKTEKTVSVASKENDRPDQIVEKVHFTGWKFSRHLDFSVDTHLGDGFYNGFMKSPTSTIPKLFIKPVISQVDSIDLLQTLVSKGNSFLNVDFFMECSDTHPSFLVVDDVYPLDHFFITKFENFISERRRFALADNKIAWWDLIAKEFTQIFRDIAHGLMVLYSSEGVSLGGVCGNLNKNMYVTKDGRGKILPSLDRTKKVVDDLEDLVEKMRFIIGLPCPVPISEIRDLKDFAISDELIDFLGADYVIKSRYVPALWLVNHPCFWISTERSSCILRLIYLTKRKAIPLQLLCYELDSCETFLEHTRLNTHWSDGIGNTLFRAILNKKKGVANYVRSIDIVRYMGACYGHVNESEYDQLRGMNIIYSEDDVEKELRSFFPKIILELFQALYGYAVSINYKMPGEKSSFMEALKDLSSCCFKTICIEHFEVRELLHFAFRVLHLMVDVRYSMEITILVTVFLNGSCKKFKTKRPNVKSPAEENTNLIAAVFLLGDLLNSLLIF
ncbi:hypothetical protein OROMI_030318 [Orobanche minor]